MDLKDAAQGYARRGWSVFPLIPGDKRPAVKWRDVSTTDVDMIEQWWAATPDAGIGVDTGKSGLVVIDVDDMAGLKILEAEVGMLPMTAIQRTGRGGVHYVYTAGEGDPLRNSASALAEGVDVRADGGYIVVAPSLHPNGQRYEWTHKVDPAELPQVLRTKMAAPKPEVDRAVADIGTAFTNGGESTGWGRACLEAEVGIIIGSAPGTRNATVFQSGLKVYGAVKGGHLDRPTADAKLTAAAHFMGQTAEETRATLDSAWGTANARHPEPREERPSLQGERAVETRQRKGLTLLNLDDLDNVPPPQWLIEGRLPEGMTVLYGPPAVGKTFVALDWSLLVAVTSTAGPVMYLPGEGLSGLGQRIRGWKAKHPHLKLDDGSFLVSKSLPRLLEGESIEDLHEACARHKPVLLVVDTLARTMVGGDENNSGDVGKVIATLDAMRDEHGTSSLVLHHTTKGSDKTERGSGALRGAADAMWSASRDELEPWRIWLECNKLKDGAYPAPVQHMLDDNDGMVTLHPTTAETLGVAS